MGNSQRPLLPEVGWDNTIDTDFKKLSVGPVKGGRPPFFFVGRNQGFAHFFGFICFIYWRTWSGEALWQDLRLCSWFDWLHSVTWLLEMPWKKGELGGILVWRMVRMSRLAKFYDKASVIKQSNFKQLFSMQAIHGIWFETNRSVNIVNISTRFGHPLLSSFSLNCEFLRTLSARWSQRRGKTLYRIGSTIHEENIKLRVVLGKLFVNAFAFTWFSMFRLLTFTKVSTLKTT